ncbi:MAG: hypothetical protein IID59_00595 [Proteobacteria bacterium]|nr:hypothetical protein [Pseudomonadota bacterium]
MIGANVKRGLASLLPVLALVLALAYWIHDVQEGGTYVMRNLVPPLMIVFLSALTLWRGRGHWSARGWQMPLGTLGFAIPAIGLSAYLHYAYSVNLDGMFDEGGGQLFHYLPYYTFGAGLVGFAIGWIVGRSV